MRLNSDILNASQLAFIEEELKPLPSQRIDAVDRESQKQYIFQIRENYC
jgi:hypothetical protein